MSGTGQGAFFAIADVRSKRPFANECKGALCGAVQQNVLGFPYAERDPRVLADHRARVLYKVSGRTRIKHLGKMQNRRILHI